MIEKFGSPKNQSDVPDNKSAKGQIDVPDNKLSKSDVFNNILTKQESEILNNILNKQQSDVPDNRSSLPMDLIRNNAIFGDPGRWQTCQLDEADRVITGPAWITFISGPVKLNDVLIANFMGQILYVDAGSKVSATPNSKSVASFYK